MPPRYRDFPPLHRDPPRVRDNARHDGVCRLITPSAISRYKVDGRRALKPPLGYASTSRATSSPPSFRFTVSHRETLPDPPQAMRPVAGAVRLASATVLVNARKPRHTEVGRTAILYHRVLVGTTSLYTYLSLSSSFCFLLHRAFSRATLSLSHQGAPCQFVFVLLLIRSRLGTRERVA